MLVVSLIRLLNCVCLQYFFSLDKHSTADLSHSRHKDTCRRPLSLSATLSRHPNMRLLGTSWSYYSISCHHLPSTGTSYGRFSCALDLPFATRFQQLIAEPPNYLPRVKILTYNVWSEGWCVEARTLQIVRIIWNSMPVPSSHSESMKSKYLRREQLKVTGNELRNMPNDRWVLCGDFNFLLVPPPSN